MTTCVVCPARTRTVSFGPSGVRLCASGVITYAPGASATEKRACAFAITIRACRSGWPRGVILVMEMWAFGSGRVGWQLEPGRSAGQPIEISVLPARCGGCCCSGGYRCSRQERRGDHDRDELAHRPVPRMRDCEGHSRAGQCSQSFLVPRKQLVGNPVVRSQPPSVRAASCRLRSGAACCRPGRGKGRILPGVCHFGVRGARGVETMGGRRVVVAFPLARVRAPVRAIRSRVGPGRRELWEVLYGGAGVRL